MGEELLPPSWKRMRQLVRGKKKIFKGCDIKSADNMETEDVSRLRK